MDDRCSRCGFDASYLLALARFADTPDGWDIDHVCVGCATRTEQKIAGATHRAPELVAFCRALMDGLARIDVAMGRPGAETATAEDAR